MISDGSFSIGSEVWPGVSKLIEEMGELTQVLGKLIATHGAAEHWDGTDLGDRLYDEVGDVLAAVAFFGSANRLDQGRIKERVDRKLEAFADWHLAGTGNVAPAGARP